MEHDEMYVYQKISLFPRDFWPRVWGKKFVPDPGTRHAYCRSLAAVAKGSHEQWKLQ